MGVLPIRSRLRSAQLVLADEPHECFIFDDRFSKLLNISLDGTRRAADPDYA